MQWQHWRRVRHRCMGECGCTQWRSDRAAMANKTGAPMRSQTRLGRGGRLSSVLSDRVVATSSPTYPTVSSMRRMQPARSSTRRTFWHSTRRISRARAARSGRRIRAIAKSVSLETGWRRQGTANSSSGYRTTSTAGFGSSKWSRRGVSTRREARRAARAVDARRGAGCRRKARRGLKVMVI